jgi:RNA polymerase sigma-70 factor (ECF subfamily)
MHEPLDHELMEKIKAEEEDAFALLIRRHQSPLLNFFHRLGANSDAEDLVQEVFLRLYRYRDRYAHSAKFTTFLYTLARRAWADRWRKRQRIERIEERARKEMPAESDGNLGRTRDTLDAQQALTQLPEKLRIVLVMSLYQGLRYDEIAAALEIPTGTVKSRVFLALRRLKEIYHDRL